MPLGWSANGCGNSHPGRMSNLEDACPFESPAWGAKEYESSARSIGRYTAARIAVEKQQMPGVEVEMHQLSSLDTRKAVQAGGDRTALPIERNMRGGTYGLHQPHSCRNTMIREADMFSPYADVNL